MTALSTMTNYVYKGSQILDYSAFTPIEDLVPTAGDTALIFLSADRVRFIEKVDDAWYSAHRIGVHNATYFSLNQTIPYFLADEPASILGCNLLFQVCDPSKPPEQGCSPWGGQADTEFHDVPPRTRRDKVQNWAMHGTGIPDLVQTLRASSLTSRFRLLDALQSSLPSNQWQLEVHHWHDIELVGFQAALIESATGPGDSGMLKNYWKRPSNDEERYVCRNQVRARTLSRFVLSSKFQCPIYYLLPTDSVTENNFYRIRKLLNSLASYRIDHRVLDHSHRIDT